MDKNIPLEILQRARAYIAQGWTTGANYRNAKRERCSPRDAVTYDTYGALFEGASRLNTQEAREAFMPLRQALTRDLNATLSGWNDTPGMTQLMVLMQFDRWIKRAAEDPSWGT